jgi:two-component system chemotaxis response regulator CheB
MTAPPIRVLVVDDSAFARKVLREVLGADPSIAIVGIARDGLDALEKIVELRPDVVTLDLVMPNLDGLGVLRALREQMALDVLVPHVLVVSMADHASELGLAALEAGAVDIVQKPTSLATDRLYEMAAELIAKVKVAAAVRRRPARSPTPLPGTSPFTKGPSKRIVVIGASTGGPQALTRLLTELPADFPLPLAIALHMPPGYTEALAARLDRTCAISVAEASEGLELRPGLAVVARAGMHLKLVAGRDAVTARLDVSPITKPHRPSVDVLFETAAAVYGAGTLGVVLTGMGDDGLEGARAIRGAGGVVLTEDEASCVVYGMPRSVQEAGLSSLVVSLERMAAAIQRHI